MVSIDSLAINDKSMVYGYAPRKPLGKKPYPSIIIVASPKDKVAPGFDEFVPRRPKKPAVVVIKKNPKHKPVHVLPKNPPVSRERKAAMGLASFLLSGLGQVLNGQKGKAAGFFLTESAAVLAGAAIAGPIGALLFGSAVKTACVYDAVKNAKSKEVV